MTLWWYVPGASNISRLSSALVGLHSSMSFMGVSAWKNVSHSGVLPRQKMPASTPESSAAPMVHSTVLAAVPASMPITP